MDKDDEMGTLDRVKEAIRGELGQYFSLAQAEKVARAAIAAMLEPSEAMIEAGDEAHASNCGYQYSAVSESFSAMIEEALAEDTTER